MSIDKLNYAIDNLRTLSNNISAYASYAHYEINEDAQPYYNDKVDKAERAVKSLVKWLEKNGKDNNSSRRL